MIPLLNIAYLPLAREYLDPFLLSDCAGQLIAKTLPAGELTFGPWLFIARLGEGVPVPHPSLEDRLWTEKAEIAPTAAGQAGLRPEQALTLAEASSVLDRIARLDDLVGIAVFLGRDDLRNADLIHEIESMSGSSDTAPVIWRGHPPSLFDAGECP